MSIESGYGLSRRSALSFMGAAAVSQIGLPGRAAAHELLDLTDRGDFLTAIAKMRGSTDDRVTMGWVRGTRYAVVDDYATPMWNILAGTFFRYTQVDDENYEIRSIEVAYFTDLETNKLLETWNNPITNAVVEIPQTRMGPSIIGMSADGLTIPNPSGEASGMTINHVFKPAVIVGDDVWISEEIRVDSGAPKTEGGHRFVYNENSSYQASLSELSEPATTSVPAIVHFNASVSFRPWMGFGDIKGHTISRGAGRHIESTDGFDPYYIELTQKYHPDILDDIDGVLAAAM